MDKLKTTNTKSYDKFIINSRITANKAFNVVLWICTLTGPMLAAGISLGLYDQISYRGSLHLTLLLIVLATVHLILCQKNPSGIVTSLFALLALDIAIAFLMHEHAQIAMTLVLVPLLSLFFCDKRMYLYAVVINYLIMMWSKWSIAPYEVALRNDYDNPLDWFIYIESGYTIETILLGITGYMLCHVLSNYFRALYDSQKNLMSKEDEIHKQMDILMSFSDIYGYLAIIDLYKWTVTNINSTGQIVESADIPEDGITDINRSMIPILNPEDVESFLEFINLNTLGERMNNRTEIYKEFNSRLIGWFRIQLIAISGSTDRFIFAIQDIDDVKQKEERLLRISNTDELTKVYNRHAYEEELKSYMADELPGKLLHFSIDINGLKRVNDAFGHQAGDELIKGAADCISAVIKKAGKVYRTGGDEFQILIETDMAPEDIKNDILKVSSEWEGDLVKELAMSIGYASVDAYPDAGMQELEKYADKAMYLEKEKYYREKGLDRRLPRGDRNEMRGRDENDSLNLQNEVDLEEDKFRRIITFLSDDVSDLYTLEVKTKKVDIYRHQGNAKGINGGLACGLSYEILIESYISNNVWDEDRDKMRKFVAFDSLCQALSKKKSVVFHYKVNRDDELHFYYLKCVRVGGADDFDMIIFAFVPEDNDVNDREVRKSIEIDELTGIYTRQAFYHKAKKLLEDNPGVSYDLTISDVANFKLINSVYGEGMGDDVLRHLAKFFLDNTQDGICARYGGDVFVGLAKASSDRKKDWLLDLMEKAKKESPVPNILLKCGVYTDVDRSLTISAMCDRALLAVKSVKHNYTMPYATYEGQVSQRHLLARTYESLFEKAIKEEEFVVYYQPQYDSQSEEMIASEALVRWQMDDGKFVSPAEFIPIFEENGLIAQLDEYVFRKVCKLMKNLEDQGVDLLPVSVNLSRASVFQSSTASTYKEIAKEIGISPNKIALELTESASIDNQRITDLMTEFIDAGFDMHLDDFGSGLSSLSCFNTLPFNVVKLDKSIIDCIGEVEGEELLRHIIELAHFKKMKVVAEGVEKESQLEFLRGLNCDTIQGFYFSAPIPCDDLVKYYDNLYEDRVITMNPS